MDEDRPDFDLVVEAATVVDSVWAVGEAAAIAEEAFSAPTMEEIKERIREALANHPLNWEAIDALMPELKRRLKLERGSRGLSRALVRKMIQDGFPRF